MPTTPHTLRGAQEPLQAILRTDMWATEVEGFHPTHHRLQRMILVRVSSNGARQLQQLLQARREIRASGLEGV